MKKLKIAVIYSADLPNTFANSINTIKHADAFVQMGHEVTVFYLKKSNKQDEIHTFYDVSPKIKLVGIKENFFYSRNGKFWTLIQKILDIITKHKIRYIVDKEKNISKIIVENNYDLVYARSYRGAYYLITHGIPTIVEMHTTNVKHPQVKKLLSIGKYQNFIISTISDKLKEKYASAGFPAQRIIVQQDAVDIRKFVSINKSKNKLREELGISLNKKIIMYAGSLRAGKGIDLLLEVAKEMRDDNQLLFYVVGGPDDRKEYYKNKAENIKLNNVVFIGFVNQKQIPNYLKSADILLLLYSRKEKKRVMDLQTTSPIKLFEYMASGNPIIATETPNITKILEHLQNAMLQKFDDTKTTKEYIYTLLNNQQLQSKLAQNALNSVKKHTYVTRCERLLNEISYKKDN